MEIGIMNNLDVFESTVQKTHAMLNDIERDLGWKNRRHDAYSALRAVLQVLRDRLTIEEVAHVGAQLPMLVRGFFYEGWKPSKTPRKLDRQQFLVEILAKLAYIPEQSPERFVRSIFSSLIRHTDPGSLDHLRRALPHDIATLLPFPSLVTDF